MGFFRQEYWSGLPFPSPEDLSNPGIKYGSPAMQANSSSSESSGKTSGPEFSSVAQLCPTLCDPMDCSTPGFPFRYQLPGLTQTHIHQVGDAIQSSHLLSPPSPPAFNLSQHQRLFQWVSSSNQLAKVLEFQLRHPVNIQDWSPLGWTGWISLQSKGLSRVFSSTTVQKHQFFSAQLSL